MAYERWEAAKQRPDQKVTVFKAYLEDLEGHLPPFSEEHRAMIFLAKLNPDLKIKVLGTGIVLKTREEILAQAIMQEKTLERQHRGGGGYGGRNSNKSGNQKFKDRPEKGAASEPAHTGAKPKGQFNQQTAPAKRKTSEGTAGKKDTCWNCGGLGHWKGDCPNLDKTVAVSGAVESKNDSAPQAPHKRSRKGQ